MASDGRVVQVIGVPLDHGAGRRGVGMGPSAIRIARLHEALARTGWAVHDVGDINIPAPETQPDEQVGTAKHLPIVARACEELAQAVLAACRAGEFPLVIGGDHAIAIGTISGLAASLIGDDQQTDEAVAAPPLGVIWFDAHADINTPESSPSGNIHGMPVACLLGDGPRMLTEVGGVKGRRFAPERMVQIGLRDIDEREKELVRQSGIHTYTMADIDQRGMATVVREALEIATDGTKQLHVSFDIDAVDPRFAPGTGTPKLGGLTFREAHLGLELIAASGRLTSFEMVEVNPILDHHNQTAEVAVGLIASAMGKRIL